MAERKGNIKTQENVFNIMVNLYIIRYLYRHMEKAPVFMDATGQRKKTIGFDVEVNISRQRLMNIFRGTFMLTEGIKLIYKKFGIDEKYFQTNGRCIEIKKLDEDDWKVFFNVNYGTSLKVNMADGDEITRPRKVQKVLENLLEGDKIANEYADDTALFKIYYYWENGTPYTANSRLTRFVVELQKIKISDWEEKEENIVELKQYQKLLARHADYLKKVIDYKEAKMNMQ